MAGQKKYAYKLTARIFPVTTTEFRLYPNVFWVLRAHIAYLSSPANSKTWRPLTFESATSYYNSLDEARGAFEKLKNELLQARQLTAITLPSRLRITREGYVFPSIDNAINRYLIQNKFEAS